MKRKVLGRKWEGTPIACVAVLEPSYRHGAHAHVLLEDPYSVAAEKAFECVRPIGRLIVEEWARLAIGGAFTAQDVQPVYDLSGVLAYMEKTIGGASMLDRLDINNFCLPDGSAP